MQIKFLVCGRDGHVREYAANELADEIIITYNGLIVDEPTEHVLAAALIALGLPVIDGPTVKAKSRDNVVNIDTYR